jgi:DNA-binding NarL/FixJ family response regulator
LNVIRVVVADDHPVVRAGLLGILAREPLVAIVGVAEDGPTAIETIARTSPDVALIDLRMPGKNGAEVAREVAQRGLCTRVLILTTYESDADVRAALLAGARGYVLKDALPKELSAAIRAVAEGRQALAPRIAAIWQAPGRTPPHALSPREVEVLRLVARGESNKTVGAALDISEATVKTHMLHIFSKLGVDDRTAAVTQAIQRGLLGDAGR